MSSPATCCCCLQLPEVLAEGSSQIPFLSEIMWAMASFMRKEVAGLGDLPFKKSLDKFPPHLRHAAGNLQLLDQVGRHCCWR